MSPYIAQRPQKGTFMEKNIGLLYISKVVLSIYTYCNSRKRNFSSGGGGGGGQFGGGELGGGGKRGEIQHGSIQHACGVAKYSMDPQGQTGGEKQPKFSSLCTPWIRP